MRKVGDIWVSFFFIFFGIVIIIKAIGLPVGTVREPQPGFFPLLAGILMTVLSVLLLIHACLGRSTGVEAFGSLWRPAILIMGMIVYTLILDFMGYVIATIILSATILGVLGIKTWWILAGVSSGVSIGSYVVFGRLLGITLPNGILEGIM